MNVRWCGEYDRLVITMFHRGETDDVIASQIPDATAHAVELRRSLLGLNRRYGGGDDLAEFGRRLLVEAERLELPPWRLFAVCTAKDLEDIARLQPRARQKTPFLEVAGLPAGL